MEYNFTELCQRLSSYGLLSQKGVVPTTAKSDHLENPSQSPSIICNMSRAFVYPEIKSLQYTALAQHFRQCTLIPCIFFTNRAIK